MNKITKIGLGLAAATLALTATAVPATAATADASNDTISATAAGDRVEGKLVVFSPPSSDTSGGWIAFNEPYTDAARLVVRGTSPGQSTWDAAAARVTATYTFPTPGTLGPIISNDNGLCLQRYTGGSIGYIIGAVCDGSASQDFQILPNGILQQGTTSIYLSWSSGYTTASAIPNAPRPSIRVEMDASRLTPVVAEAEPVAITGPTAGSTVPTLTPTVDGSGEPGATIVIRDADGNQIGTGTVGADGTWSIVTDELPFGDTTLTAEQTTTDGQTSSDSVNFTIADPAQVPIADPLVAGGILTALAAAAATAIIRRRTA